MESGSIAITGATGALGSLIARRLADLKLPMRLIARDTTRLPTLPGAQAYQASYHDTEAFARAVEGVDTVFLVSLPESPERRDLHRAAVQACGKAGVGRIVYTSFINAAPDATFTFARDHYDTEQALEATGIPFVALRNNLYLDVLPNFAADGVLRGPAGKGKFAPVARSDVAAVATAVITSDSRQTQRLDVTGPTLVDLHEIAQMITDISGKPLHYHEETVEEAYQWRSQLDISQVQLDGWISSYTAIAAGEMAQISDTVERLLGRAPLSPRDCFQQILATGI